MLPRLETAHAFEIYGWVIISSV